MATYLLTWNPKKFDWKKEGYNKLVAKIQNGKTVLFDWSCGNTKAIQLGDRVFLLRQGKNLPGLIGSGIVTELLHRVKNSAWKWQIGVDWNVFLPSEKALTRNRLLRGLLPENLVNAQRSGYEISQDIAIKLEKEWGRYTRHPLKISAMARGLSVAREGETVEQRTYVRERDRRLRNEVMNQSKGFCEGCGTDYSKKLDGKAIRVLQVHHKKQLGWSDKPRLTKTSDLAVLCANCHLLIHIDPKKPITVKSLRNWIKKSWSRPTG